MILGHYGLAFAAKRVAPRTSLGTFAFAAQWLDELWPILVLAGIERVRVAPGLMAANPLDFEYYPYSHSLAAAIVWSVLLGGIALELLVFGGGIAVYLRMTRARDRIGSWALWAMVAVLVLIFVSGFISAPPPNGRAVGFGALGLWLFVPWSYWIDRHRELTVPVTSIATAGSSTM